MAQKHLPICVLFLVSVWCSLSAQQQSEILDPDEQPTPKFTALTGVGTQWFAHGLRTFNFSIEKPFRNRYNHLGITGSIFYRGQNNLDFAPLYVEKPSVELGVFYKMFMHGRLSGRKASYYYGPEIRYGTLNYQKEVSFSRVFTPFSTNTFKFLIRAGLQHNIGPATIEIALPIGVESETLNQLLPSEEKDNFNRVHIVALPTLNLGYTFIPKPKPAVKNKPGSKKKAPSKKKKKK